MEDKKTVYGNVTSTTLITLPERIVDISVGGADEAVYVLTETEVVRVAMANCSAFTTCESCSGTRYRLGLVERLLHHTDSRAPTLQ